MRSVDIHEAKNHLSRLVEQAASGEEIVIAKAGRPMAKLVPIKTNRRRRKPGSMVGKIRIAEDFDAPLPDDLLSRFLGGS